MKRALILTYNRYPEGDAGAVRQLAFAKLLLELQFEPLIIGMGPAIGNQVKSYKNIKYTSFRNSGNNFFIKVKNFIGYKGKLKKFLKINPTFDLILTVDLPLNAMMYIEKYAKNNNITLLHDSVEWYSPEEFKWGRLSPEYFRKDLKNRFFFKKPWKIIAISSYLQKYFESKGLDVIRIPVVLDIQDIDIEKKKVNDKTLIVYAGSPGKKDCFEKIIDAICLLNENQLDALEIRIIGVTEESFRKNLEISNEKWENLKKVINCIGRISRDKVLLNLKEADYTILIRNPELRYSKAGFPTKVPESLASGTPVICNLTSDLGLYLKDGFNAVLIDENNAECIANVLKKVILDTSFFRREMQQNAFNTALHFFDYKIYKEEIEKIIQISD